MGWDLIVFLVILGVFALAVIYALIYALIEDLF